MGGINWAAVRESCSHNGSRYFKRNGYEVSICTLCDFACSIGPANNTGEAVAIEIRAAELAGSEHHWRRLITNGIPGEDDEVDGFLMHCSDGTPATAAEWAGYLARCIHDHDARAQQAAMEEE